MPLQITKLDDRNFKDLVDEALSLIPNYAPEWTNHNPSDPGITLIELFAYLTEMLIYRLNRITTGNVQSFLKLLNGPKWSPSGEGLEADIRKTIQSLQKRERAVTSKDFEELAKEADSRIARTKCIQRRNFLMDFETESPGHVSLIIVPKEKKENKADYEKYLSDIIDTVKAELEPRRLLTTQLHVVGPEYFPVDVEATVVAQPDVLEDELKTSVTDAIKVFMDPLIGGEQGDGWQFGRDIFVSELYKLIDKVQGVNYVTNINLLTTDPDRRIKKQIEKEEESVEVFVGLKVKPYELVLVGTITVTIEE